MMSFVSSVKLPSLAHPPASTRTSPRRPLRTVTSCASRGVDEDAIERYIQDKVQRLVSEALSNAGPQGPARASSPDPTVTKPSADPAINANFADDDGSDYGTPSPTRADDMQGSVWRKPDGTFDIGMKIPLSKERIAEMEKAGSPEKVIRIMNKEIQAHRERRRGISTGLTGPQATSDYFETLSQISQSKSSSHEAEGTRPAHPVQKTHELDSAALAIPNSPTNPVMDEVSASVVGKLLDAEMDRYRFVQDKALKEHRARVEEILTQF